MTHIFKKIAMPLMAAAMAIGLCSNAYAVSLTSFDDSFGRTWGNPFDGLGGQTKSTQISNVLVGYPTAQIANTLTVLQVADFDYGDKNGVVTIPEMEAFIKDLFFGMGTCTFTNCGVRFAESGKAYSLDNMNNSVAFGDNTLPADGYFGPLLDTASLLNNLGIFWYVPTATGVPAPAMLGLLGSALIGLGYTAYRRKK